MELIGRAEERELMQALLDSKESKFLAVYGRRRVGKTYLIRKSFQKNMVFECAGLMDSDKEMQLENFWLSLSAIHKQPKPMPTSWLRAFNQLKEHISSLNRNSKKVIFLDEVSWFDTQKSGFLSALDNFWNQFCTKRNDIILVICGSAASWIIQKIVNNKGGLHNRITDNILLKPFTLNETKHYLESMHIKLTLKDISQLYMSTGGIPYYLNHVKRGKSIGQIINDLFFNSNAALKNEFGNLYKALFKHHEVHQSIIMALSKKQNGMTRNEITSASGLKSGGGLTDALEELLQCGFIAALQPINKYKVDTVYRLIDEFSLFYLNFIYKKSAKLTGSQMANSQRYKIWSGYAFENLCVRHTDQIANKLGINGIQYTIYSWFTKGDKTNDGTQIDLIFDRSDNCINLFEIKFLEKPLIISKQYTQNLQNKLHIFQAITKTRKNIFVTLLTSSGSIKNEHYLSVISYELELSDLFMN